MNKATQTRKKNKREEAQFSTEFHRGAEARGFERTPVPDSVPVSFKGKNGNSQRGGQVPKCYDLKLEKDGLSHAIELKQTPWRSLARSEFKKHQLPNLAKCVLRGGCGWVVVVFHDTPTRFREVHAATVWNVIGALRDGRSGLSLDWFRKWGVQLPKFRAPKLDPKTFEAKLEKDGSFAALGRSWDFEPAHLKAMSFLERKPVRISAFVAGPLEDYLSDHRAERLRAMQDD